MIAILANPPPARKRAALQDDSDVLRAWTIRRREMLLEDRLDRLMAALERVVAALERRGAA